jgi:type IV secretory pathway VirB10-like protein
MWATTLPVSLLALITKTVTNFSVVCSLMSSVSYLMSEISTKIITTTITIAMTVTITQGEPVRASVNLGFMAKAAGYAAQV